MIARPAIPSALYTLIPIGRSGTVDLSIGAVMLSIGLLNLVIARPPPA